MRFRILPLAVAAGLFLDPAAAARAQQATELDDVVVTATRTAVTVDQSLAAVEVIDREQIERSQAQSLQALLRGRAGINLANQGGNGKLSTLFLRGTESDHVLVLVDGVRIGSATAGLASFQDLPLAQVERIEIVRGPRSSLYGSEAIGGVIQIFTRRAGKGVSPRLQLGAGSHGLREGSAGIDIGGERGWFGADAAYQRSDGINACDGFFDPTTFAGAGCFIVPGTHTDRDGYRNRSLSVRGGVNASETLSLEARALRAEGHNDYDGDFTDNSDVVQQVVGGKARWTPNDAVEIVFNAGRNTDLSESYLGDAFSNRFRSTRDSATVQGDFTLTEGHVLSAGFDWQRDRADVDDAFSAFEAKRLNRGVFAQYQGAFGAHDLQAALRHDEDDQFGGRTTGSLAWGVDLSGGWRLTASHGTAFKAPTFNELYFPFFGNPDLAPESSRSSEVGVGQRFDRWHWQFNAYHTRIDDLIAFDADLGLPNNIAEARIRGAELSFGATLGGWELSAQASHVDPRSASGTSDGNQLPRRARNSARIDADRTLGHWSFGASLVGESRRYDDLANTRELGGYGTLDLRAGFDLAPGWRLLAGVSNVLDKDYETVAFYNQPGREATLSLRYAPKD